MEVKSDIEIAQACAIKPIRDIAAVAGVDEEYLEYYGKYKAKIDLKLLNDRALEWLCKLAVFNAVLTLFWFGLHSLFLPFLPETLQAPWMVYAAGNAAFVIYDVGFSKLISFYVARVDRVLRKTS